MRVAFFLEVASISVDGFGSGHVWRLWQLDPCMSFVILSEADEAAFSPGIFREQANAGRCRALRLWSG